MNSDGTLKNSSIKCQKCRHVLLEDARETNNNYGCDVKNCSSYSLQNIIYLIEEKLPKWIRLKVENEQWTKGKLHCENCGQKVGSFDFVSGRKCECKETVLPPVHFISSQVDRPIINHKFNEIILNSDMYLNYFYSYTIFPLIQLP